MLKPRKIEHTSLTGPSNLYWFLDYNLDHTDEDAVLKRNRFGKKKLKRETRKNMYLKFPQDLNCSV